MEWLRVGVGVGDLDAVPSEIVDVGAARGWDIRELQDGRWAWSVWSGLRSGSGVAATEVAAQTAAQRELERIVAEDAAADQHRRELPMADTRPTDWDPQC
jgi:hypothetical protein